jgi:uncharacterized lipoprotein YddW (UPF0748 family)
MEDAAMTDTKNHDAAGLVAGWSCDERNRTACRNGHGCHCREVTAQAARIAELEAWAAKETESANKLLDHGLKLCDVKDELEQRALTAERALATARTDAFEEAAKIDVSIPSNYSVASDNFRAGFRLACEMKAAAIRAASNTDASTSEKESADV